MFNLIKIIVFQSDTGGLVEDTTALGKMYVEGTLAKLPVTSEDGELYVLNKLLRVAVRNLRGRTV